MGIINFLIRHPVMPKQEMQAAVRDNRRFAQKEMHTQDVRVDTQLNRHMWSRGIRNVPRLVRVRISRKKNEEEDAKQPFYSTVQLLEVESFENLQTERR